MPKGIVMPPPETVAAIQVEKPFLISIDRASLMPVDEVIHAFESDPRMGLSAEEAERRLKRFGRNEMAAKAPINPFRLFVSQFMSTVVLLLVVAAIISFVGGEHLQAIGIGLAVFINALVGFITEYKAQVSLAALEKLSGPVARARRNGKDREIPVSELVPGDIIILEEGARVPADLRIVTASALSFDESMLSGESIPVYKCSDTGITGENLTVAFQGSLVLKGRAKAIVVATGASTKLGQLGLSLGEIKSKATPLQDDLEKLGRQLSLLTVLVCFALFLTGILHGEGIWAMVQSSIALAVAAIPEGLPVVATLALASGTNRMVKLGALIRKLSAVETLGCTEVICTDKTGTLTQNQMTVSDIIVDSRHINVSGIGYIPEGEFTENGAEVTLKNCSLLSPLLNAAVLCNDARLELHEDEGWHVHGDPTEGALLALGLKAGFDREPIREKMPRQNEFAFDLNRKRMTTIHGCESGTISYTKGAPETVISLCRTYESESGIVAFDDEKKNWFARKNQELAAKGLRVLGFAAKKQNSLDEQSDAEKDMTFLGLIGMSDKSKEGVRESIEECRKAGIKVIMLTGDQPATALAVAKDLNIVAPTATLSDVVSGKELLGKQDEHIKEVLGNCSVLARVKPEAKLSIVKALQSAGKVVAMTGDGINDAPALRQSDIGVAMGQKGTSLAREASDMVITDDNFPTIVHAVEQGRVIYANISCAVAYLLTASLASVFTVAGAVIFDTRLPLSPLQLLWLNLIMHIFPGLGLVLQNARPGIMNEKPRGRNQSLLGKGEYKQIIIRGLIVAAFTLLAADHMRGSAIAEMRTAVLATISLGLLMQSWAWLALKRPKDDASYFSNPPMLVNTVLGVALLLAAVFFTPLQSILCTVPPSSDIWTAIIIYVLGSYLLCSILLSE